MLIWEVAVFSYYFNQYLQNKNFTQQEIVIWNQITNYKKLKIKFQYNTKIITINAVSEIQVKAETKLLTTNKTKWTLH